MSKLSNKPVTLTCFGLMQLIHCCWFNYFIYRFMKGTTRAIFRFRPIKSWCFYLTWRENGKKCVLKRKTGIILFYILFLAIISSLSVLSSQGGAKVKRRANKGGCTNIWGYRQRMMVHFSMNTFLWIHEMNEMFLFSSSRSILLRALLLFRAHWSAGIKKAAQMLTLNLFFSERESVLVQCNRKLTRVCPEGI